MLIERIIKPETSLHGKIAKIFNPLKILEQFEVLTWFAPLTIMVAGMAAKAGTVDRYSFWEFSEWIRGSIGIIILIIGLISLKKKNFSILMSNDKMMEQSGWVSRLIFFLLIWMLGWGSSSILSGLGWFFGYVPMFLGIFFLYFIKREEENQKPFRQKVGIFSSVLFILSCIFGWILDDPILATSSIVMMPFSFVMAFTTHSRHVQRAHIYPLFILIGFVISRQGWFIIPVLFLFYLLRFYNYFIYKTVSPSFAVEH
jgi:hypothetical protein